MDKQEEIIEERKKNFVSFLEKKYVWVGILLVIALILGIYIRALPMTDHGGKPGLWDITTNNWTLGPDLDPFLFLRYAETIGANGSLPHIDYMRNVPLGFDTSTETQLLPYMIVWTYDILHIWNNGVGIDYAAVIFPVIMFALTIIAFFLFVREIFIRKDSTNSEKIKANIIALISTFFMVISPTFLSRTIAGIPEKESAGFFFMFFAFYLFLKAWRAEKIRNSIILGVAAGITTALMGLVWGGVIYIFVSIAVASLGAFILNKVNKKEFIVYSSWIISSALILLSFTNRLGFKDFLSSLDTGLASLVFFIFIVHFILWNTKIKEVNLLNKIKLPKNMVSFIIAFVLLIVSVLIFFGSGFIVEKINVINQMMFQPVQGRWDVTVAENRQPYFNEWAGNFGPYLLGKIPVLFWLFFIGSVILFKEMLGKIKRKDSWILTILYILFFFGLVFSRYSSASILNGENLLSKSLYYVSALLLIGTLIYYYTRYHKEGNEDFEKIDYEFLFLFSLFVLTLFTARSAVRLIMVLAPIAPIFLAYLIVWSADKFIKTKGETNKLTYGVLVIIILLLSVFIFWNFYNIIKSDAYNFVPSSYTQQWQKAMQWVRTETPTNAVFAHWWDYGYWVQSMGKRATVTDGGNAITYWNYLSGRYVLTGDNQKDALEFLYTHNATHLLIDSSDIGKYTAFSSIGSNLTFDRYSWIPIMISDQSQIQETDKGITRIYQGGSYMDEDTIYNLNGTQIFLPAQKAAIIGVILNIEQNNNSISFNQPEAVFLNNNQQIKIPLRYLQYKDQFVDFKNGLGATFYVTQNVINGGQGIKIDDLGAGIYMSPRLMRGMFAQIYLLNDPFNRFTDFKLVHSEPSVIIDSLNSQGAKLNEFAYDSVYSGTIQGPIKIWKINYEGNEKVNPDYLLKSPPASINWQF